MNAVTDDPTVIGRKILALDEATDAAHCGQKAATLGLLKRAGHRIPDGFVIPAGVSCSVEDIQGALERFGHGRWAVRSSGLAEDLEGASFAGQYETVLDVTTADEIVAAIARVLDSGSASRVAAYRDAVAIHQDGALAVLVQRLVNADAAGVAFSANPVTGADEVVIEAVRGLGDRLVSGDIDADRWVEVADSLRPVANTGVIDASIARRIAALARRVAQERGTPQDIEWAVEGGELCLLQARPITGLPQRPDIQVPPGRWIKDTIHWSSPMTPAGASILLPVIESAFARVFAEFGLPLEAIRLRSFGGEIYSQEIDVGGKHNPGQPPPWWVLAAVIRLVPSMRRLVRTAEGALHKLEAYPRAWEESWREECARRVDEARAVDPGVLTDQALLNHLQHLIDNVLTPGILIHFQLTLPNMVGLHQLVLCCSELLGWDTAQAIELLSGVSTTVTMPVTQMSEIAELVDGDVLAGGLDAVRATAAGPRLDAWLDLWGMRSIDFDPGSPTIVEHQELVLGMLRQPHRSSQVGETTREAALARARAALRGEDLARFEAALSVAELVHAQREENVLYTQSLPCGLVRRTLLEIGRRLVAAGQLNAPDDVVFLELDELRPALEGGLTGESAMARIRRRRAERAWVQMHPGPAFHGPAPVPPPSLRGMPAPYQLIMGAIVWETAEEMVAEAVAKESTTSTLAGVAASPGRYTGRVRVIRSESELPKLEPGEVLVCPTTHSSWAVVFSRAGALVTDNGGMLSHPSILAREYGIPAVVATGRATSSLTDGQIVTVDGATGRVELIEP